MAGETDGKWDFRNSSSPIWPIARLLTIAIVAATAFSVLYSHGYDIIKDSATLTLILAAVGGVDGIQRWIIRGTFNKSDEPSN